MPGLTALAADVRQCAGNNSGQSEKGPHEAAGKQDTRERRRLRNGRDGGDHRDISVYIAVKTASFPPWGPGNQPGPFSYAPVQR
jgi:hypothetical protein